jgi:hypothetical protein
LKRREGRGGKKEEEEEEQKSNKKREEKEDNDSHLGIEELRSHPFKQRVRMLKRQQQRNAKREVYLHALADKGRYNFDKPLNPDKERWLPKEERSYNLKKYKNKNKSKIGQGGRGSSRVTGETGTAQGEAVNEQTMNRLDRNKGSQKKGKKGKRR